MAVFLNTEKLTSWIRTTIDESEKELIIVVPYIKTSNIIYSSLVAASLRGVEITVIYREDKLNKSEKDKLLSIDKIKLFHHPNVHCKCYYNGELLVIGSMNLYEYSEKNNREMGILIHKENIDDEETRSYSDDVTIFYDAMREIREIINGSELDKDCKNRTFEIEIIKSNEDLASERCEELNLYFLNKKFKPLKISTDVWHSRCTNYFDKVDVVFEDRRVLVDIRLEKYELDQIFDFWKTIYDEFEFKGFKYYINKYNHTIYLYKDNTFEWELLEQDDVKYYKKIKIGIDSIIDKYRKVANK